MGTAYSNDTVETPDVTFAYDRRGRQTSIAQGSITTSRTHNDAGLLLVESYSGGPLSGLGVTNAYDSLLRRQTLAVSAEPDPVSQGVTYDLASRLATVTQGAYSATYSYVANSSLIDQIDFRQNSTVRMTLARQYDALNRLTNIVSTPTGAGQSAVSFGYLYNQANQRTRLTRQNGAYWIYQYDELGQVISGKKYWADGTPSTGSGQVPVAGQQFAYNFDDIGNRKNAGAGGNQWGTGLRYEHYSVNDVNQYTSRTVPGAVDVLGEADDEATVTVNNYAAYRKGDYFRAEVPVGNLGGPVWLSLTNLAVIRDDPDQTNILEGNLFLPQSPEPLAYDDDGNLVSDGRWNYVWDAENRLVSVETISAAVSAGVPKQKLVFAYDWQGRRISKTVSNWTAGAWVFGYQRRFLYDGWLVIAELDDGNDLVRSYAWGLDLSGTVQGAGGVGGLLFVTDVDGGGTYAVGHDGNGNVSVLVDAADGTVSAEYEYEPFGRVLKATGPMARSNPIRFSTKYQDEETGLYDFGYRPYDPDRGRWPDRDPLEEYSGLNLYLFVSNDAVDQYDFLGLLNIIRLGFRGAGKTEGEWLRGLNADEKFNSTQKGKAFDYVIAKLDTNGDGNISNCDDEADIRITRYSWGAWTAVQLAKDLGNTLGQQGRISIFDKWKLRDRSLVINTARGTEPPIRGAHLSRRLSSRRPGPYGSNDHLALGNQPGRHHLGIRPPAGLAQRQTLRRQFRAELHLHAGWPVSNPRRSQGHQGQISTFDNSIPP